MGARGFMRAAGAAEALVQRYLGEGWKGVEVCAWTGVDRVARLAR
jgi:hypothetical protein